MPLYPSQIYRRLYGGLYAIVQWCRRGTSSPPKVSICRKSGQNPGRNSWKYENPGKNGAQRLTFFSKTKNIIYEDRFLEVIPKKDFHDLCERKFGEKSHKNFSGHLGKSGKNPSHPKKFACSYTYSIVYSYFINRTKLNMHSKYNFRSIRDLPVLFGQLTNRRTVQWLTPVFCFYGNFWKTKQSIISCSVTPH